MSINGGIVRRIRRAATNAMQSRMLLKEIRAGTLGAGLILFVANACFAVDGVRLSYSVTDLGATSSTGDGAKAINAFGQVGVSLGAYAYVWANGAYTPLGGVNDGNGPLAINNLGDLAGAGNLRGFIYRNGQSTDLGQLDPDPNYGGDAFAYGINDNDVVVGEGYRPSINAYHAFVWSNGLIHDLTPAARDSSALAINNAGMIVGAYNQMAARWDAAGNLTVLPALAGYIQSGAVAVDGNGDAAGASVASGYSYQVATVWSSSATSATALPLLGIYPVANATGINDLGEVVGTAGYFGLVYAPVLWQNGMAIDLNTLIDSTSGWSLGTPEAINDAGQIAGVGALNGIGHAYLLTPISVPEPSLVALVSGAFLLIRRQRRPI
jgi:probable HAF family extracellular repeat protein